MKPAEALAAARQRDPLDAPWGLFLAPEGGAEGLCWFADRDQLHAFVESQLWPALAGNEPDPAVQAGLAELLEERPGLSWALLEELNLRLEPVAQVHWWGTVAQLHDGEDPFAKDLREAYREQAPSAGPGQPQAGRQEFSKLAPQERAAFAAFVRSVWED